MVRVPSLSANGRFVAFSSTAPYPSTGDWFFEHVFVYDLVEASLRQVDGITDDKDLGPAYFPRLSADGSTVAFISTSGRLVEGDTNGRADVFVAPLD